VKARRRNKHFSREIFGFQETVEELNGKRFFIAGSFLNDIKFFMGQNQ
jgi:hypothetical protein